MADAFDLITEDWLKSVGFRWHQLERQPNKHWLLWLGESAGQGRMTWMEDLGIEVAFGAYVGPGQPDNWFCWLRSDAAGRYHRFIHLRHIDNQAELIALVEAISGQTWNPENHRYGTLLTTERAAAARKRDEDLDRRMMREHPKWSEVEKDDSRGRALPEHLEAHEKAKEP
jgi:hypothetical protein